MTNNNNQSEVNTTVLTPLFRSVILSLLWSYSKSLIFTKNEVIKKRKQLQDNFHENFLSCAFVCNLMLSISPGAPNS